MALIAEKFFGPVSLALGIPIDQIVLVSCLLASFPLGLIQFYFIKSPLLRHFYSITFSLIFILLQFEPMGLFHFTITSLLVYIMLLILPRNKVALPVLIFLFVYLSTLHIHRIVTDYMGWKMENATVQMLITCKLSLLAYSYQDAEVIKTNPSAVPAEQHRLTIEKIPSLLEYYSFICFYPSFTVGPCFEYLDYINFIHLQNEFRRIPDTLWPGLKVLGSALIFMGLTVVGDFYFSKDYCNTEEFGLHEFWYKVLYFNAAAMIAKFRYSSAWKITEASMIATGLAYTENPKSGYMWERGVSINYQKAELAWTAREMVENWNISVCIWLRKCIYNRILLGGKDPLKPSRTRRSVAQHGTYLLSALWHGFYPAYYMMFFFFSVSSEISKMVYTSNWSFLPYKNFFKWVAWILMWQIGNFNGLLFLSLDFYLALTFMRNIHYYPLVLLVVGWGFFKITGLHRKNRAKED